MIKITKDKRGYEYRTGESWSELGFIIQSGSGKTRSVCPLCSNNRKKPNDKCVSIDTDKNFAFCSHCDQRWRLFLPGEQSKGEGVKKQIPRPNRFNQKINQDIPEDLINWLHGRGITEDVIQRNKLGQAKKYFGELRKEIPCISFPFYQDKEIKYIKYRTPDKKITSEKGGEPILYGYNDITVEVIWVEGEMDKLAVEVAGFTNCVSVPNGASTTAMAFLETAEEKLRSVKRHIIAVDNDAEGRKLAKELTRRLGIEKIWYVTWPEDCKDANDVLMSHGPAALKAILNSAVPAPVDGIFSLEDFHTAFDDLYENGLPEGLPTGWSNVDRFYRVVAGQMTIIVGIPSHGKSEWVDALMVNMAVNHDWKFAVFSPENFPLELHASKLARKYVGKPFGSGCTGAMTKNEKESAKIWINRHFRFLASPDVTFSLPKILELARVAVYRDGVNGIVIDPWNECDHARERGLSETEYTSKCLTEVRKFARHNNVHVWMVVHPVKRDKEDRKKAPTLYDCSGSAHWYNKTDNGIAIFRKDVTDKDCPTDLFINKIRFRQNGQLGQCSLRYEPASGRYNEL
jgi:twinkle protein